MAKATTKSIGERLAGLLFTQAKAASGIRTDLDRIGEEIIAAQNKLADTRSRPVTRAETEERIDGALKAAVADFYREISAAALAAPSAGDLIPLRHPTQVATTTGVGLVILDPTFSKSAALGLAYLSNPEAVTTALVGAATAAVPGEPISSSDRAREIVKLEAEIAELEILRERFAREAERHGLQVPRSEFADPGALLMPDDVEDGE
jgi:hypothetical protein